VYTAVDFRLGHNPLWGPKADCAFPCATQNEINGIDAQHMSTAGAGRGRGRDMPTNHDVACAIFLDNGVLFGPGQGGQCRRRFGVRAWR
jgi:glutamate dehydrogenase (NADP+)